MSQYCPYNYNVPGGVKYARTFPMPSEKERDRRWQALRAAMKKNSIDAVILVSPPGYLPQGGKHLHYVSNYVSYAGAGAFVVFPQVGEPLLWVSTEIGPQFQQCAAETTWITEIVGGSRPAQDILRKIQQLKLEKGKIGVLGYRTIFPAGVYDVLRENLPSATLQDVTPFLNETIDDLARTGEEELAFLRTACKILDIAHEAVARAIKPGVKECELWGVAEKAIIENGGWHAQSLYVASGPSPALQRAPASLNPIGKGDAITFEVNATYGGITSQMSWGFSLGHPDKELEKMFEICKGLFEFSLAELEKNRTFLDIELDLSRRIHDAGYEPLTPQIHRYNFTGSTPMKSPPRPGDYFTVHPNLGKKDYSAGAKLGETVRINKNGKVERLQTTPVKLHIV